jgi:ribosome biogenesis GTPase
MNEVLAALDWDERCHALFEPYALRGWTPGRVIRGDRGIALVATPAGITRAAPSARVC